MTTTQRPRTVVAERPAPEVVRISTGELERQLPTVTPPVPHAPPHVEAPVPGAGVPAVFMDAPVLPALPSLDEIRADLVPQQRDAPRDVAPNAVPDVDGFEPMPARLLVSRPSSEHIAGPDSEPVTSAPRRLLVALVVTASAVSGMLFAVLLL